MKCPYCGMTEMEKGMVQSGRTIFFTTKAHKLFFTPNEEEVMLSEKNWTRPTCETAYHCAYCKKVVIDYSHRR